MVRYSTRQTDYMSITVVLMSSRNRESIYEPGNSQNTSKRGVEAVRRGRPTFVGHVDRINRHCIMWDARSKYRRAARAVVVVL